MGEFSRFLAKYDMGFVLKFMWSLNGNISFLNDNERLSKINSLESLHDILVLSLYMQGLSPWRRYLKPKTNVTH